MSEPRTPCAPITGAKVAEVLAGSRLDLSAEHRTQADIERLFACEFGAERFDREHRFNAKDRPDFLVDGRIVVEVKRFRRTSTAAALAQLERYAAHAHVAELVLATGHAVSLPGQVGGKRLFVVNLGEAWL
jgi:hypothetical protein